MVGKQLSLIQLWEPNLSDRREFYGLFFITDEEMTRVTSSLFTIFR